MKKVNNEELKNVNGGSELGVNLKTCVKCKKDFVDRDNVLYRGSGCDKEAYFKCPHCGHEFE